MKIEKIKKKSLNTKINKKNEKKRKKQQMKKSKPNNNIHIQIK